MKEIKRQAHVHWEGDLMNGRGDLTTESKALEGKLFSVPSRSANGAGTNPEELIAAAQASCFSMMLAKIIGDQKFSLEEINTRVTVVLQVEGGGAKITELQVFTEARVLGMSEEAFRKAAELAKETCPVSTLLKPGVQKITLEAALV